MPSTYSPNLRIELIGSGEQANTWGNTTNTNLGTVIEEAICGLQTIDVTSGNVTLTALDGISDQSRAAILSITGTPGTARSVYCPDGVTKLYTVTNNSDAAVTISTVSGTGVSVGVGSTAQVYSDGTNVLLSGTSIGIGQTWTNVTGSRSLGVTYTNNTGKPIMVTVNMNLSSTGSVASLFAVYINGISTFGSTLNNANASAVSLTMPSTFIVPNGQTYAVSATFSTVASWWELS